MNDCFGTHIFTGMIYIIITNLVCTVVYICSKNVNPKKLINVTY